MAKTACVTGGSGALGSAIVERFAAEGYDLAFCWHRNTARAEELSQRTGGLAVQADLTDSEQARRAAGQVLDRFGSIDVLVNCAGQTQVLPFAMIEEEDWDEVMAANLKTMFLITHEVARGMIHRRSGIIINIGSLAGHRMLEVPVHYATAKAAVTGFTISLARELSRYGVRVNEVVPGLLSRGVGTMVPEKELAEYRTYCAAGRVGEPEEVADVVAFLASDGATYINAQSLFVDGGI